MKPIQRIEITKGKKSVSIDKFRNSEQTQSSVNNGNQCKNGGFTRHVQKPSSLNISRRNSEVLKSKSIFPKVPKVVSYAKYSLPSKNKADVNIYRNKTWIGIKRTKSASVVRPRLAVYSSPKEASIGKKESDNKVTQDTTKEESDTIVVDLSDVEEEIEAQCNPETCPNICKIHSRVYGFSGSRRRRLTSAKVRSRSPSSGGVRGNLGGLKNVNDLMIISWSFLNGNCRRLGLAVEPASHQQKVRICLHVIKF